MLVLFLSPENNSMTKPELRKGSEHNIKLCSWYNLERVGGWGKDGFWSCYVAQAGLKAFQAAEISGVCHHTNALNSWAVVEHATNPSSWEAEAGESLSSGQPGLQSDYRVQGSQGYTEKSYFEKPKENKPKKKNPQQQ